MENRPNHSPAEVATMGTDELRHNFLVTNLFTPGQIRLIHSHTDRVVLGGVMPGTEPIPLPVPDQLRADYFLQRREAGIFCIAGSGTVTADGTVHRLATGSAVYLGRGTREVSFASDAGVEASFYLFSAPAHLSFPNTLIEPDDAATFELGDQEHANRRTLKRYIHPEGVASATIVMGLTRLQAGSMWNTMPAHTHDRRTEAYLYIDLPEDARVVHLMGEPTESRHLIVANNQAVISPSWSLHCGVATEAYAFIWAMAGENQDFTDMDTVTIDQIR